MVKKEGLILILTDELEDAFDEDILGIGFASGTNGLISFFAHLAAERIVVAGEGELFTITPEVAGIEAVATDVVVVTFVVIPAEAFDLLMPSEETAVELAELSGAVAGLLGDLAEEDFAFGDGIGFCFEFGEALLVFLFGDSSGIALNGKAASGLGPASAASVVQSGEKGPAGGSAVDALRNSCRTSCLPGRAGQYEGS